MSSCRGSFCRAQSMTPRRRRRPPSGGASDSGPRGTLHPTLDLHGYTGEEAARIARRWLKERRADGERVVRIITGRGLHSIGLPVLPSTVEDLLETLQHEFVAHYERESGGGAFSVTLRRPDRIRSLPNAASSSFRPELVRQAEESLAELGIAPTPALIEAEARRIIREQTGASE